MKRITFSVCAGIFLVFLSLIFTAGWYSLISVSTALILVFSLILIVLALVILYLYMRVRQRVIKHQLHYMAYHDALTGLANRNMLEQFINRALITAKRHKHGFALFFLDLDHFKVINDTVGHDTGDILLKVIAERLQNIVRSTDIVARLGGDEFVIVVTEIRKAEAMASLAQKMLDNLVRPIFISSHELYITTSIGISFYPDDGQDMQTLMHNADLALYRAKEQGRNNFQFCVPEITVKAQEKLTRQKSLALALLKDEFLLYYQPKIDLITHQITGVEALLRWQNGDQEIVPPNEVIALAEEAGLIIRLSEWILETACEQAKSWQMNGYTSFVVSVNISLRQFKQAHFVESVEKILNETHLPGPNLELEITESILMQEPESSLHILNRLKKLGIRIAVDNFGTGHLSVNHLRRFPVDAIKIDKTLTQQITTDKNTASLVPAIIAMAKKMGIKTIAEGVETKEQYEFLLHEGCVEMQGYYLTEPLSSDVMTQFLKDPAAATVILQNIKSKLASV